MVQGRAGSLARRWPRRRRPVTRFPALARVAARAGTRARGKRLLEPDAVSRDGPARVLVGTHGGATSSIHAPASLNYLAVRLRAGESWRYQPAFDQTIGWVALSTGRLRVPERVEAGELAIFEPSNDAIDIHADAETEFVLGSAAPHAQDLVLGPYSVHTSRAALRTAQLQINEIQGRLRAEGRL